ncbi:unnamed protein product [Symbiodinium natans]|uniref:Uncharacterized protein n=1 Tax=Symbiodinium natans TaxID=878477 RepID=A0A812UN20_9DINO|nr:unnamed protein product [Symbiodinium natans]
MKAPGQFVVPRGLGSLSQALQARKRSYDEAFQENKKVYDLSQSRSYMRTELVDSSFMTLTKNSSTIFSSKHNRSLAAQELFTASATGSPVIDISNLPSS